MSLEGAGVSFAAAVVSGGFAALVLGQWARRPRPYRLAWGLGLALYAVASFAQFWAEAYGWSVPVYKVYYVLAAALVAVLGVGSAGLLDRRLGLGFALYTAALFAAFAFVVAGAAVNEEALAAPIPAGTGMPPEVRLWSPLFTVPGSIALIGIAAWSYWRTRLAFNAWIAAGAAVVAAGGSLARFNVPWALYAAELVGVALMFWGFLLSRDLVKAPAPTPSAAAAAAGRER